jgi:hypothetical protein
MLRDARNQLTVAARRDHHVDVEAPEEPRARQQRLVPERPQRVLARRAQAPVEPAGFARAQRPAEQIEQRHHDCDRYAIEEPEPIGLQSGCFSVGPLTRRHCVAIGVTVSPRTETHPWIRPGRGP